MDNLFFSENQKKKFKFLIQMRVFYTLCVFFYPKNVNISLTPSLRHKKPKP